MRFEVLGPLRIEIGGASVTPPRSPVLRGLLGVLLIAEGRPLTTSRLIDLVWGERAGQVGHGAVQAGMSRLRQWLRGLDKATEPVWTLEHDGGGYRLEVPPEAVDLGRFRVLVERARAREDAAERCGLLESALALWRGPTLVDVPISDPGDTLFRSVEDDVHTAAMDMAAAALAAGRPRAGLARLSALAEAYPIDEGLQACLIELLAADGRPAEALRRYQAVRERVVDELGVEPGDRVHRAYLSVLGSDREAEDAHEPSVPVPAQLPPDVPDFTGRAEQAVALSQALASRRTAVVAAIAGMGGVGKTTLALHVAHGLAAEFPDGQLYANLGGADAAPTEPAQVLSGFLLALGVGGRGIPQTLDERAALYRSLLAGRRMLIVLDNVLSERHVRPLLPGARGSAALVTSRVPLTGLEGARLVNLDVFEHEQAIELLGRIAGRDRVAAEPGAAAEVVRLCAHMPLAVRIAGARLSGRRHWSLSHLAATLADERRRLDELTAGDLAVRACFTLSYAKLPGKARELFRLLGLLETPDFGEWVAAALLDISFEAGRSYLEALVDAQLLTVVGTDQTGRLRYRYHDLVRLYARERAEDEDDAGTRTAALRRVFGAWLWLAERAADQVPGPCYAAIHGPAARWPLLSGVTAGLLDEPMSWFDAERAALVAAVDQACELGLDDLAWDLAGSLEKYFDVRGLSSDWRRLHERALGLCRGTGDRLGEAVLLRGLIEVTTWTSADQSSEAMVTMYEQSQRLLRLFEQLGERRGMSDALVMVGWGLVAKGDSARAVETAREALRLARETDHLGGEARAHHLMAIAYGKRQIEQAIDHLMRTLELARLLGNRRFEATAMQFLGAAHCLTGRIESGHDLLVQSLRICHALKDRYAEAFSLLYLAKLYAGLGDERARPAIETVISVSRQYEMHHHLSDALQVLGELEMASGRFASATIKLDESVRLWRTRGWPAFLADALRSQGLAHQGTADHDAARKAWTEALELYEQLGDAEAAAEISALLDDGSALSTS